MIAMNMSMTERIKAGKLFTDMCEGLPEKRLRGKTLMYEFNHSHPSEVEKRESLIKEMFATVGENAWVEPPVYFSYGSNIHIGRNFYANFNLTIVDDYTVTIDCTQRYSFRYGTPCTPLIEKKRRDVLFSDNDWQ